MTGTKAMLVTDFLSAKVGGRKLSMVTCYDYTFARLLADSPIDAILVGDSAAVVMHGYPSTLHADVPMIALHTSAVARGAGAKFIVADMPFLSHRKGLASAMEAACALMKAGAHAVKLEGVDGHEEIVRHLVQSGIPVMGHLGLQPQSIHATGGYHVQGKSVPAAETIFRQAEALQQLGAFAIVLECVPAALAGKITQALRIPVIGIGAGAACDGQVLVLQDLFGLTLGFEARFARAFHPGAQSMRNALTMFDDAVKAGTFPSPEESYR